eukprot:jgi/Bigna1/67868/fgenesh1_pg.4_\
MFHLSLSFPPSPPVLPCRCDSSDCSFSQTRRNGSSLDAKATLSSAQRAQNAAKDLRAGRFKGLKLPHNLLRRPNIDQTDCYFFAIRPDRGRITPRHPTNLLLISTNPNLSPPEHGKLEAYAQLYGVGRISAEARLRDIDYALRRMMHVIRRDRGSVYAEIIQMREEMLNVATELREIRSRISPLEARRSGEGVYNLQYPTGLHYFIAVHI